MDCPWDLPETKRLEVNEIVFVSFWRHVHVVAYRRRACVDEEQGDDGRENDARFGVVEKGENERGIHGR